MVSQELPKIIIRWFLRVRKLVSLKEAARLGEKALIDAGCPAGDVEVREGILYYFVFGKARVRAPWRHFTVARVHIQTGLVEILPAYVR